MALTVCVLGPVSIDRSGIAVPLGGPKVRLLLAVLAAQRGRVLSTDRLCEAIWGDDQPGAPVTTLQSHLSRLRRTIEPEATVMARPPGYVLVGPEVVLDADRFELLAARADAEADPAAVVGCLAEALSLWRGPAFGEYAGHDQLVGDAVRLEELRLVVTERWIDARLALGDETVIGDLERLVDAEPLQERFWCQLMLGLHRAGRQAEALRRANELRALRRDEFGLEVSAAARDLEARIHALDPDLLLTAGAVAPARAPPARSPVAPEPDALVGREDDLARIAALAGEARLVSLVGPGGVGKTRLARRIASSGGAVGTATVMVELAAVGDAHAVPEAVATALDVQRRQHRSVEDTLVDVLHDRTQLIVLDNCEHVLDAVCALVDLLWRECPTLRFLSTSRQPLGLPSEVVFTVEPLRVASSGLAGDDLLAASPAVQLFLDRASAARPGFVATAENLPALAELCRRLDGLPLALELAAARIRSLGPEAMVERLDQRFRLLDAGPRHGDQRHRTLGDLVGWSYELLTATEQAAFARLSVFAGAFDLRAAEAVCGDDDDTLEVILALIDKSMVQVTDPDEPRYHLLETLREFGRARLAAAGDTNTVSDVHLEWYLALAEQAAVGLGGPDEAAWGARIDRDFDDLRAAHAHAVRRHDVDRALRLVAALREHAFRRIRYEVTSWAATSVAMDGAIDHPRYPIVKAVDAYGHYVRGNLEAAIEGGNEAVRAAERLGASTSGLAERSLANALFYLGRPDEAVGRMDEMVASARAGGSPARLAHALYMRSVAETSLGGSTRGAAMAGEARAAADRSGSPTASAQAMYALGLALEGTDPGESLDLLRASADLSAAVGNRWIEAFARTEVWWLEARLGNPRDALVGSATVITTWHNGGDWANLWLSLRHVFGILEQLEDHRAAAILHGALSAAGAAYALPFEPADAELLDEVVLSLRAQLGPGPFAQAVREGAAMTEATLVAFVLDRIASLTGDPAG